MKLTHVALSALALLVGAAVYLIMDSQRLKDKEETQNKLDRIEEMLRNQRQHPASAPEAPVAPVAPASAGTAAADSPAPPAATPAATAKAHAPGSPASPATPSPAPAVPGAGAGAATPNVATGTPASPASPSPSADPSLPNPLADIKLEEKEKQLVAAQLKENPPSAPAQYNELQRKLKSLPAIAQVKSFNQQNGFVVLTAGTNRNLGKGMAFRVRRDAMLIGKVTVGDNVREAECIADVDPASIPVGVVLQAGDEIVQYD